MSNAPVLDASQIVVVDAVTEDAGPPVGAVGTLVSSIVDLNSTSGGLDNVTDADGGALTGIALTDSEFLPWHLVLHDQWRQHLDCGRCSV